MEVAWLVAPELLQRWLECRAVTFSTVPATASFSQSDCLSTSTRERHSSPSSLPLALLERHSSCRATEEKEYPLCRPLALLEWEPTQIHE